MHPRLGYPEIGVGGVADATLGMEVGMTLRETKNPPRGRVRLAEGLLDYGSAGIV